MSLPLFTVFTPTYNRAHTLPRVYESLVNQTNKDFEWLIVDDGSSDHTEVMVKTWQAEEKITIRYFYQHNQGKHIAFNKGVVEAKGELFLTFDSDDACIPNALERFKFHWQCISEVDRKIFSGITCLCMDTKGEIVGSRFPAAFIDEYPIQFMVNHKIKGEKWGFHLTNILRQYPFPSFPGERFVPEGLVWNRIGCKYKLRFINEPLRVYESLEGGLTSSIVPLRAKNPSGTRLYCLEYLDLNIPVWYKLRAAINYLRFSAHAKISLLKAQKEIKNFPISILFIPAGYLYYLIDCRKIKKISRV